MCRIQNISKTRIIFTSTMTKFTFYRFWLSKIQNRWRESFLGLSQSFFFKAFCIKRSETSKVAESFFGIYIFDLSGWAWAWSCKAMLSGGVWSFCNRISGGRYLFQNCCNVWRIFFQISGLSVILSWGTPKRV